MSIITSAITIPIPRPIIVYHHNFQTSECKFLRAIHGDRASHINRAQTLNKLYALRKCFSFVASIFYYELIYCTGWCKLIFFSAKTEWSARIHRGDWGVVEHYYLAVQIKKYRLFWQNCCAPKIKWDWHHQLIDNNFVEFGWLAFQQRSRHTNRH